MSSPEEVTGLLIAWKEGDEQALGKLIPLVYGELRRLAQSYIRRERPDHTLPATALVHEAYLRLADQKNARWQSRAHFMSVAAQQMRRILVDHARSRKAAKRGPEGEKITIAKVDAASEDPEVNLMALDECLRQLTECDPQQGRIVELRYFGGLTIEETAEALGIAPATVKRDWRVARAWLYRKLGEKGFTRGDSAGP